MAFKPNYYQERASRERTKNEKKQEKLRKREEAAAERKAARQKTSDPEQVGESTEEPAAKTLETPTGRSD